MSFIQDFTQPKVMMMKWGLTGRRLSVILKIFCLILSLFLIYKFAFSGLGSIENEMKSHTTFYCNEPGTVNGKEGSLPFVKIPSQKYRLVQVQLVVRHGDRAPITLDALPNTDPVHISCIFNKTWPRYDELNKLREDASSMFEILGNPKRTIIQERHVCIGGQLTPTGFLQHLSNGQHLNRVYSEFLDDVGNSDEILAMTTDYSRTVQSGAALLYGMFQKRKLKQQIKIRISNDKYPETHFLNDGKGKAINCPVVVQKLKRIWQVKSLLELTKVINPVKLEYAKLLDSDRGRIPSNDRITDILYTRICHGMGLPVGPNGNIPAELAVKSFELSHKLITTKHTPLAELQTLAIVSQMAQHAGEFIDKDITNKRKIVLFAGHDTILVPLLALFGVHDGKWPPYASRVVLELWKNSDASNVEDSENPYSKFEDYYFRLLYNGKPLTHGVKFCRGKLVDAELCPLKELVRYVSNDGFKKDEYFTRIRKICSKS